jgi:hypothetical protein
LWIKTIETAVGQRAVADLLVQREAASCEARIVERKVRGPRIAGERR